MANSTQTEHRAFLVLLGLLILIVSFLLYPFLNAIVLAIVLAVLFQPLHDKYLKWTRGRVNTSAALSTLSVVVLLIVPLAIVLTLVTAQLRELVMASEGVSAEPSVSGFIQYLQVKLTQLGRSLEGLIGLQMELGPYIRKSMSQMAQTLAKYSPQVVAETANFFLHFFIMLILLLYFFRDGKKFIIAFIRLTPVKDTYEHKLAAEIHETIRGVFYGNFITGLLQAVFATLGFFVLDVDGYLVWGALTFFMSFIPTVGTGAVVIPVIVTLFLQGKTVQAVILIFYGGLIVGGIDNLLRPYLMRQNMHPIFLFLSVFGGLTVFGPIGLLLGPMLMALLNATIRIYAKDFAQTQLPSIAPTKQD